MRTEEEIRVYMEEITNRCADPETGEIDTEDCYLDEGEQAALAVLEWVLGYSEQRW